MCPSEVPDTSTTPPTPMTVPLLDGSSAELVERDGGWSLVVDGVRQSHVDPPDRPSTLASVRWMLAALGAGGPLRCAHLGGGMLSLPRALAAARPGSPQVVVELEPALVQLVTDRFGLPDGVTVEVGDARAWIEEAAVASLDAVVVDVFAGGRIPPPFTSVELVEAVHRALAPAGVMVVNSVAGPDLDFTRRQLAGMAATFTHVGVVVQGSALAGARFGNATLLGSDAPLDVEGIRAALHEDPSRGRLLTDLTSLVADAVPVTDADGLWSPEPRTPRLEEARRALEALRTTTARLRAGLSSAAVPVAADGSHRHGLPGGDEVSPRPGSPA